MAPQKTATRLEEAFRSPRLLYRALENNDEDRAFFDTELQKDPVAFALSDGNLFRPQRKDMSDSQFLGLLESPLAVVICLQQPEREPESSDQPAPKPTPIGILSLYAPDCRGAHYFHHHRNMTLSINIAKQFQNNGYGAEAINWALDWAFRYANIHTVTLKAVEYNERAQHLYKKLGFVLEGRQREHDFHDRKWWDLFLYSMTENEWEALRGIQSA
jgi:RimJ/RimL family protein N-acetyltransferase